MGDSSNQVGTGTGYQGTADTAPQYPQLLPGANVITMPTFTDWTLSNAQFSENWFVQRSTQLSPTTGLPLTKGYGSNDFAVGAIGFGNGDRAYLGAGAATGYLNAVASKAARKEKPNYIRRLRR